MKRSHQYILGGTVAVLALAGTAIAASYFTRESAKPTQQAQVVRVTPTAQKYVQAQPVQEPCNDHNIVGTLGGAVVGGVIGHQFGSGRGQDAATAAGAVGGGMLGHKYIPTHNSTC